MDASIMNQADQLSKTIELPFLPTSIWGISAGMSLILVLMACGMYYWYRSRIKAVLMDSEDAANLAAKKVQLESEIEQCNNWINSNREELLKLDAERQEQERIRQELANYQVQAAEQQQKVDDLRKETNDLQSVVTMLAQDRDRVSAEMKVLEQEKKDAESARYEMKSLIDRYNEEKKRFDNLLQNMAQIEIKHQALLGEISGRENQLVGLRDELDQVRERLAKAKADIVPLEEVLAEKERARKDRDIFLEEKINLEETKSNLKREIDILQKRVDSLREISGTDADIANRYADLVNTDPNCFADNIFPEGPINALDEGIALSKLQGYLKEQGLIFSRRTINAFHTALKINDINPLTVLAGVSGTGKTLLPLKYAEAMGLYSLVVSVQPRWDSPQDLFGFYNYLEHKYKATDLARALVRMDSYNFGQLKKKMYSDRILLVLLDEMNLARVEYYFSEFLSKLELRRSICDESDSASRRLAEIELEMGPRSLSEQIYRLWVGNNIIFVGSMNEDESTQTLSDKVLDRANVLRFGKPAGRAGNPTETNTAQKKYMPFAVWNKWIKHGSQNAEWSRDVNKWIVHINHALGGIGRPFGYRVQQAICDYVSNYPGGAYKTAFADQVEQKVIPKLRGIDLSENQAREALEEIFKLIEELGDTELLEEFKDRMTDQSVGTFVWRGVSRSIE